MAFRQHNPNVRPSRHEGASSWNVTKSITESVTIKGGAKVSLPSNQHAIRHSREQQPPNEISRYWQRAPFLADENHDRGKSYLQSSTKIAITAPTTLPKDLYRIPTLNSSLLLPGINNGTCSDSKRLSSDPFQLEKLNRLGKNATYNLVGVNHLEVSQPTGCTKYVEAARSNTAMVSNSSMTTHSFKVFNDDNTENPYKEITSVSSPSKTVHEYVQTLHLLSDTGDGRSAHEAEVLLLEMINNHKAGLHDFQPDGGCYNRYDPSTTFSVSLYNQTNMSNTLFPMKTSVIHAYATAGLPHQAENVMRLMFSDFNNGNTSAEPNVRCLTSKKTSAQDHTRLSRKKCLTISMSSNFCRCPSCLA